MAPPRLPEAERLRRLAAVEKHRPTGPMWMLRAAAELQMHPVTFRRWCNENGIMANEIRPAVGPPLPPAALIPGKATTPLPPKEPEEPLAERQARRLKDEIARLKRELNQANRELNDAALGSKRRTLVGAIWVANSLPCGDGRHTRNQRPTGQARRAGGTGGRSARSVASSDDRHGSYRRHAANVRSRH